MTTIVLLALLVSSLFYLIIGFVLGKNTKKLADVFPIIHGTTARVKTSDEFSSSAVATTVSLATIVLAYFELASVFGLYLFWTVITTVIGMYIVSLAAKRIWEKMSLYNHRPSLHEFLGVEYNSPTTAFIASLCTSVGFLLIFATELIVGSKFLAILIPEIPEIITVIFLSAVGFTYTLYGGFRAVVKTDQLQMKAIWGLIVCLTAFYIYQISTSGGLQINFERAPKGIFDLSLRPGLGFFLLGIAIMNIPSHISNMSIWQRIAASQESNVVEQGIRASIWSLALSWGMLCLLACASYLIVTPETSQSLLTDVLKLMNNSVFGRICLFIVTTGLYGAMLSTASTNLIVVTHTVSEDLIAKIKASSLEDRLNSHSEFVRSRIILVGSAILAIGLVEGLKYLGFSIADLAFAIYGGSLSLFPPVVIALYSSRSTLRRLGENVTWGVILGFAGGWGAAIYGKIVGNGNLIFLSPAISISLSFLILGMGLILKRNGRDEKPLVEETTI